MAKKRPRTIAREMLRRVKVQDGDVVVLRRGEPGETLRVFNALRHALSATDRKRCIVIVTDELEDVKILNKREMLSYGWQWVGDGVPSV